MGCKGQKMVLLIILISVALVVDGLEPPDLPQFEAAFQGRCGSASPCTQLCRELHDGTYECGCTIGHVLNVDGYTCQEINGSSKSISENYIDTEDVLYQKDASFSAELDMALVPAKDSENLTTSTTEILGNFATTSKPSNHYEGLSVDYDDTGFNEIPINDFNDETSIDQTDESTKNNKKAIGDQTKNLDKDVKHGIKGTPVYTRDSYESKKEVDSKQSDKSKVLLTPVVEQSTDDQNKDFKSLKQNEELSSLKNEGVNSRDIELIGTANIDVSKDKYGSDVYDNDPTLVTTLGPSLEQKVPPMSTSGPSHTVSASREGCPLGKMGANCEKAAPPLSVARFTGSSWLALPPLRGAYKRVHLRLEFQPTSREGLLLITGERADLTGDYLAIVLRRGHVELVFDCGSGPGVVRSESPVVLNQWNTLTLYRRRWDAWMQLNGGRHVQGRSKGLFSRMTFLQAVFVGGAGNSSAFSRLGVSGGLHGCVRGLAINGRVYQLAKTPHGNSIDGYDVGECSTGGCSGGCLHGGRCLKKCLCPLGYAGDFCETLLDLQVPKFNGSSFLRYHGLGETALSWLELQITLKAGAKTGLIMYNAHRNDGAGDFFALYLRDSRVEFAFDLGTGQATIRSNDTLDMEEWYTISLSRTGRLAVLTVVAHRPSSRHSADPETDPYTAQGMTPGAFTQLSLRQNLYVGGVPQDKLLHKRIGINDSFTGCIQKIIINDREQSIVSSALGGVNIDGCPHSCEPESCGTASCRPRLHHYTCACPPGIVNDKCTIFLNDTEDTKDYSTTNIPIQDEDENKGEKEAIPFYFDEAISLQRENIVPKKGPKSHHHKNHQNALRKKLAMPVVTSTSTSTNAPMYFDENKYDEAQKEWVLSDGNGDQNGIDDASRKEEIHARYLAEEDENIMKSGGMMWISKADSKWPVNEKTISDINLGYIEVPRFVGHESYILNNDPDILKKLSNHSVNINIRFRSVRPYGLLLWLGKDGMSPGDTFMSLGVEDGFLTFRYDMGNGEVVIVANQTRVDNGLWHRARAERNEQSGVLDVDGLGAIGKASPGRVRPLHTDSGLYIGGMASIWPETLGRYTSGIEGCISELTLNREFQIPVGLSTHTYTTSRNIDQCPP